jgi:ribonuclease BN (tRNA processing enzyme)
MATMGSSSSPLVHSRVRTKTWTYEQKIDQARMSRDQGYAQLLNDNETYDTYIGFMKLAYEQFEEAAKHNDADILCYYEKALLHYEQGEFVEAYFVCKSADSVCNDEADDGTGLYYPLKLLISKLYALLGYPLKAFDELNAIILDNLSTEHINDYYTQYVNLILSSSLHDEPQHSPSTITDSQHERALKKLQEGISELDDPDKHYLHYVCGIVHKKKPYTQAMQIENNKQSMLSFIEAIRSIQKRPIHHAAVRVLGDNERYTIEEEHHRLQLGKYYRALGKRYKEMRVNADASEWRESMSQMDSSFEPFASELLSITSNHHTKLTERVPSLVDAKLSDLGSYGQDARCTLGALALFCDYPVLLEHTESELDLQNGKTTGSLADVVKEKLMNSADMSRIEEVVYDNKAQIKEFIREGRRLEAHESPHPPRPMLHVLQHWNSYTPIIPEPSYAIDMMQSGFVPTSGLDTRFDTSRGGGYFIDTGTVGIAIDPGFDFIKNLKERGFHFSDIDYVLISHAHNDHTTDLESLLTLLNRYNKDIMGDQYSSEFSNTVYSHLLSRFYKKSKADFKQLCERFFAARQKKLHLLMTLSTFKKFSTILDLYENSNSYKVIPIGRDTDEIHFDSPYSTRVYAEPVRLTATTVRAKHDDLLSDAESVGFAFEFDDCCLLYTGDTGFNEMINNEYSNLMENAFRAYHNNKENTETGNKRQLVLLAHIGGFKPDERNDSLYRPYKPYYDNHLGRLGLTHMVSVVKPSLCLVSEFGDEFRGRRELDGTVYSPRIELCKLFEEVFRDKHKRIPFVPVDYGFSLTLDSELLIATGGRRIDGGWELKGLMDVSALEEDPLGFVRYW